MSAKGQSQRDPKISREEQPVRPNYNVEGQSSSSVPGIGSFGNSNFPLTAEPTTSKATYCTFPSADIPNGGQPRPKCAELFRTLNEADWSYLIQRSSPEHQSESPSSHALRIANTLWAKASTTAVYGKLKYRKIIIQLYQQHQRCVEENISNGLPRNRAAKLAMAKLILEISEGSAADDDHQSATDFFVSVAHRVREGERWQELIDTVGAQEILLIGRDHEEDDDEDDEDNEDELQNEWILEKRFHKDFTSMNIAKLTKTGNNDVFAKMKELLMMPDLLLKETCQRLIGLSQMISHLNEVDASLTLEDAFLVLSKDNTISPHTSFLASEIHRRCGEVLGRPEPEPELEIDDEETSRNEFNSEGICESDEGDRDQAFDDDFCMNFLNNNAFSSVDWMDGS